MLLRTALLLVLLSLPGLAQGPKFLRDVRIPMDDGVTLSASLRLPDRRALGKVPCIIDMVPYRWRDGTAVRDSAVYGPLALEGYACLRVDVRGSGESEGALDDEYSERQVADLIAVIDWVSKQEWSSGKVGVMGNSWGGFAALGALKKGHPALRAAIVSCASDDGFTDDAHFESGLVLSENLIWGAHLTTLAAEPTDPDLGAARKEDWKAFWLRRLEALKPFASWWLQQRGNAAWRQVRNYRNLSDKNAPVLLTGGWLDAYARGGWRLGQQLSSSSKVLFGGGAHAFPHLTRADLSTDFTPIASRWFGRLLRRDEGLLPVTDLAWIYTHIPCAEDPKAEGYWVSLGDRHKSSPETFAAPKLASAPEVKSGLIVSFGKWCPGGDGSNEVAGYPSDPAPERKASWIYKFPAFDKAEVFLGSPDLALSKPPGAGVFLFRLFLCREGMTPRRVGYAVLDGRVKTAPTTVAFSPFGFETRPGDHLELHVLPQAFPLLWAPYPESPLPGDLPGALTLRTPGSFQKVELARAPGVTDAQVAALQLPVKSTNRVSTEGGTTTMMITTPFAELTVPDGIRSGDSLQQIYGYGPTPADMAARILCTYTLKWPHRNEEVSIRTDLKAKVAGNDMTIATTVRASFSGKLFWEKTFTDTVAGALLPAP